MNGIKITNESIIILEELSRLRLSENSRKTAVRDFEGFIELCSSLSSFEPSELPVSQGSGELRADKAQPFKGGDGEQASFGGYTVPRCVEEGENA